MSRDYRTEEIRGIITRLIDAGATGCANSYKGISPADESRLTALLISSTPSDELPSLLELDIHSGIPSMISRYVSSNSQDMAVELATYIKNLYIDYFKETIKRLMEEGLNER